MARKIALVYSVFDLENPVYCHAGFELFPKPRISREGIEIDERTLPLSREYTLERVHREFPEANVRVRCPMGYKTFVSIANGDYVFAIRQGATLSIPFNPKEQGVLFIQEGESVGGAMRIALKESSRRLNQAQRDNARKYHKIAPDARMIRDSDIEKMVAFAVDELRKVA